MGGDVRQDERAVLRGGAEKPGGDRGPPRVGGSESRRVDPPLRGGDEALGNLPEAPRRGGPEDRDAAPEAGRRDGRRNGGAGRDPRQRELTWRRRSPGAASSSTRAFSGSCRRPLAGFRGGCGKRWSIRLRPAGSGSGR